MPMIPGGDCGLQLCGTVRRVLEYLRFPSLRLRAANGVAERDIVQFVPFRKFAQVSKY